MNERGPLSAERLAVFVGVVNAIGAAGLSAGYGRVTEDEKNSFTISLTISNGEVERAVRGRPELLEQALRLRADNPGPASVDTHPKGGDVKQAEVGDAE